ncbi:MAG: ATP--guanido phosphotransferase [Phycisphaerae bacterium]|nr:ATP--guanido phosphotransferase [Phycisphaerae bacterium]
MVKVKIDIEKNCPFNSVHTPSGDVVLSSRSRLARNLEGFPFVNRATASDCIEVTSLLHTLTKPTNDSTTLEWVNMEELDSITTELFVERHLVSSTLAHASHPRAIAVGPELSRSVMVNEEDHIRIQSIRPGLQLHETLEDVKALDSQIEEIISYAFDDQLGFLTACPTNVGTGARFSAMLHLPGLRIINDLQRVHNACEDLSLAIRGYRGEGSGTVADLFQVSNQVTLGSTQQDLCKVLADDFLPPVIEWERKARDFIVDKQKSKLDDQTFRSLGVLQNARLLTAEEAMQCLGNIRLGVCMQLVDSISVQKINQLMIELHPAHIKHKYGIELTDEEVQHCRATLIRNSFQT